MSQHVSLAPKYNYTQWYLLITNAASGVLWLAVFLRLIILFPLVGTKFLPGGIADFFLTCQCTILIDFISYLLIFRLVQGKFSPKPDAARLVLSVAGRMLVSFGVLFRYPKTARSVFFSLWILSLSTQEFTRYIYNTYKVRTFGGSIFWLTFIKNSCFLFMFPLQMVSEMSLIFVSLPFVDPKEKRFGYVLRLVLLMYIIGSYSSYKAKISKIWSKSKTQASHQKKRT